MKINFSKQPTLLSVRRFVLSMILLTMLCSICKAQTSSKCDGLRLKDIQTLYHLKDTLSTLAAKGWADVSGNSPTNSINDKTFGICYDGNKANYNLDKTQSAGRVIIDGPANDYLFQVSYDLNAGNYSGKSGEVTMIYTTYIVQNWKNIYSEIRRLKYVGKVGKEYSSENEEDKYGDSKIYTDGELYYLILIDITPATEAPRETHKIEITNRKVNP